jgi:hypothetical protein
MPATLTASIQGDTLHDAICFLKRSVSHAQLSTLAATDARCPPFCATLVTAAAACLSVQNGQYGADL